MGATAPQSGFMGWILNYGQVILFFAQILFWMVLGFAAVWAAVVFNRLVTFMTTGGPSSSKPAEKTVSVEEFVE